MLLSCSCSEAFSLSMCVYVQTYLCICSIPLYITNLQLLPPPSFCKDPLHPTQVLSCAPKFTPTPALKPLIGLFPPFSPHSGSDLVQCAPPLWILFHSTWPLTQCAQSYSMVHNFLSSCRYNNAYWNTRSLWRLSCLVPTPESRFPPSSPSPSNGTFLSVLRLWYPGWDYTTVGILITFIELCHLATEPPLPYHLPCKDTFLISLRLYDLMLGCCNSHLPHSCGCIPYLAPFMAIYNELLRKKRRERGGWRVQFSCLRWNAVLLLLFF